MTEIRDQGLKRDRELGLRQPEHEANLLQLLRSGSVHHSSDQTPMGELQRPNKRQALQGGSSGVMFPQSQGPLMGLMPDANGPLIPGGSAVTGQSPAAPSRASSLSILSGQQSNLQLKGMLGSNVFSELRSAILAQQETFNRDLQEMHTIARRQEQSVSQCPNKAAMQAEFERLQAEQDYQQASDNTVEQDEGLDGNGSAGDQSVPKQKGSTSSKAETIRTGETQSAKVQENQRQMQMGGFPPGVMQPTSGDPWGMYRQNYMNPYNQQGMQGWGMPGMGGTFPGPFPAPYGHPGMMPPPMDPMLAWYTLHYGQQYHQAMQNQVHAAAAKAQQEAQEQDKLNNRNHTPAGRPVRWWQDPEKVFGLAGDPAVLQNPDFKIAARTRAQEKLRESRSEATSKPPTHKKPSKPDRDVASEKGESFEQAARVAQQKRKSLSKEVSGQPSSEKGVQKAGSGLSAFKSLATKSGRRPPTRAESIGSEMSRSGADRSPMDDADSSDVRNGAPKAKGPSTA